MGKNRILKMEIQKKKKEKNVTINMTRSCILCACDKGISAFVVQNS